MTSELVGRAMALTRWCLRDKVRRDGVTPAHAHAERVVKRVLDDGHGEQVAVLAAVHDVVEDCRDITPEDVRAILGLGVFFRDALTVITHERGESYEAYIERVSINPLTSVVKVYDIFDNINDQPTARQVQKYISALAVLGYGAVRNVDDNGDTRYEITQGGKA